MTHAIKHRLTTLEARLAPVRPVHILRPPGWMPDDEYARWKAAEVAKAPPGAECLAIKFVRPNCGRTSMG